MNKVAVWKHDVSAKPMWAKDLQPYIALTIEPGIRTKAYILYCLEGIGPMLRPYPIKSAGLEIPDGADTIDLRASWGVRLDMRIPVITIPLDDKWEWGIDSSSACVIHKESKICVCSIDPRAPSAPAEVTAAWTALMLTKW